MIDRNEHEYDVIVAGGGPAGASAATVLAGAGCRVLVLEKDSFPRYHVGESLLPYAYFPLQRLGLLDRMKQSEFPVKHSVQFVAKTGKIATPFYFFNHTDHELAKTWQVTRSEFDTMLLDNARAQGATVRQQTRVTRFVEDGNHVIGVETQCEQRGTTRYRAPITIDATGRSALAVTQHGWRRDDPMLNRVAVWTYYRGALRDPGLDAGSTTIAYLPDKCWFWYIPLARDMVSVGIVGEKDQLLGDTRDLEAVFQRHVSNNPWVENHLAPGTPVGKYYGARDFSYRSEFCARDGLVLAGDAYSFLDPVFSSGLYFALRSGVLAADTVLDTRTHGDFSADRFAGYARAMRSEMEAMRKLVYAFYDQAFSFGKLIRKYPDLRVDLTDCLIGNLDKDFSALFAAAAEFARLPEPLPYGRPLARAQKAQPTSD